LSIWTEGESRLSDRQVNAIIVTVIVSIVAGFIFGQYHLNETFKEDFHKHLVIVKVPVKSIIIAGGYTKCVLDIDGGTRFYPKFTACTNNVGDEIVFQKYRGEYYVNGELYYAH